MEGILFNCRIKRLLDDFVQGLIRAYADNLVSALLYGSAASGDFIAKHSNLNIMIVLKDANLAKIKAASSHLSRFKFRFIHPAFFSQDDVAHSLDVFPIEFLDMQEKYLVLFGKDVLSGMRIDRKNLRFQCEHELRSKLINLRYQYATLYKNKAVLKRVLVRSFTSITHIARSILKLQGKNPAYTKSALIQELALEFNLDRDTWSRILEAKKKPATLNSPDIEELLIRFVRDVEKIIEATEQL